jgi:hypothetical protein
MSNQLSRIDGLATRRQVVSGSLRYHGFSGRVRHLSLSDLFVGFDQMNVTRVRFLNDRQSRRLEGDAAPGGNQIEVPNVRSDPVQMTGYVPDGDISAD